MDTIHSLTFDNTNLHFTNLSSSLLFTSFLSLGNFLCLVPVLPPKLCRQAFLPRDNSRRCLLTSLYRSHTLPVLHGCGEQRVHLGGGSREEERRRVESESGNGNARTMGQSQGGCCGCGGPASPGTSDESAGGCPPALPTFRPACACALGPGMLPGLLVDCAPGSQEAPLALEQALRQKPERHGGGSVSLRGTFQ